MSSNFQKTCKNKFGFMKNRGGPQTHLNFSQKKNATGEIKLANGIRNRVNMSEVIASEKCGYLNALKLLFQNTLCESKC